MRISKYVQTLVVDNNKEEAKPVLAALNKIHAPALYYSGAPEEFPNDPFVGVRLIFLDIELEGMAGKDEKQKAGNLVQVVSSLISLNDNGPLSIVFWTKHVEVADLVVELLRKEFQSHITYIAIDKNKYKRDGDSFAIDLVAAEIDEKFKKQSVVDLYSVWENAVSISAAAMLSRVLKIVYNNGNWDSALAQAFYRMYKAVCDKEELEDNKERFIAACQVLGRGLKAEISRQLNKVTLPNDVKIVSESTCGSDEDKKIRAGINTLIHLYESNSNNAPKPGFCFLRKDEGREKLIKEILLESQFSNVKPDQYSDAKLCIAVITPQCDLAQNKLFGRGDQRLHRVVYGLIYPTNWTIKNSQAFYKISNVLIDSEPRDVVFCLATISSLFSSEILGDHVFSLAEETLFDLQSKAANQVNRLGVLMA